METIKDIKENLEKIMQCGDMAAITIAIEKYSKDHRDGVKRLVASYTKKLDNFKKELARLSHMQDYERIYQGKGYRLIAGIDEVGRGPLAGPVVSAAVILPTEISSNFLGINDSKKLSADKRQKFFQIIKQEAIAVGVGIVEHDVIDKINILNATKLSMKYAVGNMEVTPDYLLIDAVALNDIGIPNRPIISGDQKSVSIAAASIIAKVTRDMMMEGYHDMYPEYNFMSNKGYGVAEHVTAIKEYGLTPIHRRSFTSNL